MRTLLITWQGAVALAVCIFLGTNSHADGHAEEGYAVLGSYQDRNLATSLVRRASDLQKLTAEIRSATINGRVWFRVVVPHADARSLVTRLRQQGFPDAWFLKPAQDTPATHTRPQPSTLPASAPRLIEPATPVERDTALALSRHPVSVAGGEDLLDVIDGIPVHQITIPTIPHDQVDIKLDGYVTEPLWQEVPDHDNMIVAVPGTGEPAHYSTRVRMLATDRGLYVSSIMQQPPETLVTRMSNRDDFIDRDTFGITLDTSGEGLYGYWFILALGDTMMDGKVLPERNYQNDWDGPWLGKSARLDDGWSVEFFLPWSMMQMRKTDGPRKIGFAVARQVSHENQRYQWPGHPYAAARFVSALNIMQVDGVQPRQQFSLIPYTSATIDQARDEDETRVGMDISWRPSPKVDLTASVFPDFGAVEADNVVLNLTALETFFPEKRLFFLEGNEVFSTTPRASQSMIMITTNNENFATTSRKVFQTDFMPTPTSLMNTRRIGGTASQVSVPDGVTPLQGERDRPTDLLGAAKLAGRVGGLRYGLLGAFEDDVEWLGQDAAGNPVDIDDDGRNFTVARLLYESVGSFRSSFGYLGTMVSGPRYDAIVHGLDAHFTSARGSLIADVQLMTSDVDDRSGDGALFDLRYFASPHIQHKVELDYIDEQLNINDLGFLRRNDYAALQYSLLYNNTKGTKLLDDIRGTLTLRQQYNVSEGQIVDSGIYWRNSMVLPGRNTIKSAIGYLPERFEDIDSRGNGAYRTHDRFWWNVILATDATGMFSYSFSIGGVQEHLGDWTDNLSAGVTFRPVDNIAVDLDVKYKRRDGWLVYQGGRDFGAFDAIDWQPSLKLNWFIMPKHELRLTLQWAGVRADEQQLLTIPAGDGDLIPAIRSRDSYDFNISLLTAQLRYRWEIAPLTDFYLVYNLGNSQRVFEDTDFTSLFEDSFNEPIIETLVAKFRYRFGN